MGGKMTQVLIDRATLEQLVVALNNAEDALNNSQALIAGRERFGFAKPCYGANEIALGFVSLAITQGRAALANAEPIARMQPVTKTRVGNYLNKHPMGDLTAYRHGFKDGVKWREQL